MEEKRVALITGASSGIGEATARLLLQKGWRVLCAARRLDRMEELRLAGAELIRLDLCQKESILDAAAETVRLAGRLDLLVNNAGYGSFGAVEDIPVEEARRQMEVNLFGAAELIRAVLPLLKAAKGRIINISSAAGRSYLPMGGWYHCSKYSIEALSHCLRWELRGCGVRVIVVAPGAIRSEWYDIMLSHLREQASAPYSCAVSAYGKLVPMGLPLMTSVERVAKRIVRAATASYPRARYPVGLLSRLLPFGARILPPCIFDRILSMFFGVPHKTSRKD